MGLVTTDSNLILTGTSDSNPLFPAGLADLSATGQDAGLGQEGESYATGTDLVGENYAPPEIGDGAMAGYIDTIMGDASRRKKKGAGEDDSTDPFAPAYVPPTDETPTQTVVVTPPAGPANNAPVLGAAAYTVAENAVAGTVVGAIPVVDPDGDPVLLTLTGTSYPGAVSVVGGNIVVAGPIDFEAVPSFTVTVQADDGKGGITSRTYTIGVTDVAENAATIAGVAGPAINTLDATDVHPFAAAVVTHPDPLAILTATVTVDDAAKGVLSGAGVTDLGGGVYRITGTAAQVETALRAAVENSTDSRLNATGQVDAAMWTVTITDGSGGSSTQSVTVNATQAIDSANQDSFVLPFNVTEGAMTGGAGYDVVQLQAGANTFDLNTHLVQTEIMDQIDEIQGTASNDTLTFDGVANTNHMFIDLGGGTDQLNLDGDAVLELANIETVVGTSGQQVLGLWSDGVWNGDLGADAGDQVLVGADVITLNITGIDNLTFDNALADVTMGYALNGLNIDSNSGGGTLRLSGQLNTIGEVVDVGQIVGTGLDDTLTIGTRIIGGVMPTVDLGGGTDTLLVAGASTFGAENVEIIQGADNANKSVTLGGSYDGGSATVNFGGGYDNVILSNAVSTISLDMTGVEALHGPGVAGQSVDVTLLGNVTGLNLFGMQGANDTVRLAGGTNSLSTVEAVEHLMGSAGNDDLTITNATNTTIELGGGDDTIRITGATTAVDIWGGAGADTFYLSSATSGVRIRDFNELEGDRIIIDIPGLTLDTAHFDMRGIGGLNDPFGEDVRVLLSVDQDGAGPGAPQDIGELLNARSAGGELNGDAVGNSFSGGAPAALAQDWIDNSTVTVVP